MSNLNRTKVRRLTNNTITSDLPLGELAFNSDTYELFVGTGIDTPPIKVLNKDLKHLIETTRKLSIKLTRHDLDTSSDEAKIKLNNLAQEVHDALSGKAPANSGITEQSIVNEHLADDCVDNYKVKFTSLGKNLFNNAIFTCGFLSGKGEISILDPNGPTVYYTSDFIPVKSGLSYAITPNRKIEFYDLKRNAINLIDNPNQTKSVITASKDGYMRVSFQYATKDYFTNAQIEQGKQHTSYEPYGLLIPDLVLSRQALKSIKNLGGITSDYIPNDTIKIPHLNFLKRSKNLFNAYSSKNRPNTLLTTEGDTGIEYTPSQIYGVSHLIYNDKAQELFFSNVRNVVRVEKDTNTRLGFYDLPNLKGVLTLPKGYFRITYPLDFQYVSTQVEVGSEASPYETYGAKFDNSEVNLNLTDKHIREISGNKLTPNSVDVHRLDIINAGKNKLNLNKIIPNCFVNENTNGLNSDNAYFTSEYIPVSVGEVYTLTRCRKWVIVDRHFTPITGGQDSNNGNITITASVNGYLRASFRTEYKNQAQIERGSNSTSKKEYELNFDPSVKITPENLKNTPLNGQNLVEKSITPEKTDFIDIGNFFDQDNPKNIPGYFLNVVNSSDELQSNATYGVSHFIPVKAGTHVGYAVRNLVAYNTNKKPIQYIDSPGIEKDTYQINQDGFVKISYYINYLTKCVFARGTVLPTITQHYKLADNIYVPITTKNIKEFDGGIINPKSINPDRCSFIELGKNLYNFNTDTLEAYINPTGKLTPYADFRTSDYIPVKANTDYHISKCRKLCVYDSSKIVQQSLGQDINPDSPVIVNLPFDGYIRISTRKSYYKTVQVELGKVATPYEVYGFKFPSLILPKEEKEEVEEEKPNVIALDNVDRIGAIGDSYTESHYTLPGKAYICKLSLFSDYNWENFARSGDTYRGNLDRIRKGNPIYHSKLSWKDFKPTHALCISYTNDMKYMDNDQYGNDLRAIIETVKGLGAIPILATEYHCAYGRGIQNTIKGIANEYGLDVIDILPKAIALRGKDYAPFWGGSHPGTRSNHLLCDPLEDYFKKMPRPYQSIKIFRKRDSVKVSSLDDLVFNTNVERARKFKEIMIGHSALNNPEEYDSCSTSQNSKITSEYLKLLNKESVQFGDYALIDVILPSTARDLDYVDLVLSDTSVSVYTKDVLATPYASPLMYQRFDYEGSYNIVPGAVYVSNDPKFGSTQFRVEYAQDGSILMNPNKSLSSEDGVLTKVSGEGASTINYFYTAVGFSPNYPEGKANIGHWTKANLVKGKYRVSKEMLEKCMDYDKISFLVTKTNGFSLKNVSVEYQGTPTKARNTLQRSTINALPSYAQQILPEQFIGNTSQFNNWTKTGTVNAPYVPVDKVLPKSCEGCVDIKRNNSVSQKVTINAVHGEDRKAIVRLWVRYFPKVFDKDTMRYPQDSAITEDTFDYATVTITQTISNKKFKITDLVGLGWKEVEFEMFIPSEITDFTFSIASSDKDIQLAKASIYLL